MPLTGTVSTGVSSFGVKAWCEDHMESMAHYLGQLVAGAWLKGLVATLVTIYIEMFRGDIVILNVYFMFAAVDLFLGTWYALRVRSWSPRYLLYWVRKLLTYVGLVSVFGGLCMTITLTTGSSLGLVNWLLLCCIITEFGSILKNIKRLGLPLPPLFEVILRLVRRRASEKLAEKMGLVDEESRKDIARVINGEDRPGKDNTP